MTTIIVKRHPFRRVVSAKRWNNISRLWEFTLSCGHKCRRWRGSMKYVRCQDCAVVAHRERVE